MTNPTPTPEPTPIEVTEEMRRAVYELDCKEKGHLPNFNNIFTSEPSENMKIGGTKGKLPFVTCDRCNKVWLLIDVPGFNYLDALNKLKTRLKPEDDINKVKA